MILLFCIYLVSEVNSSEIQKVGHSKHAVVVSRSGRTPSPTIQAPTTYVSPTSTIKTTTITTLHTATHIVPPPRKKRRGKIVGDEMRRPHPSSLSSSSFVKRQVKSKNKLLGACICA